MTRQKRRRIRTWVAVVSAFVIGLATFFGAIKDVYRFCVDLIPVDHKFPYKIVETPTTVPAALQSLMAQPAHKLECPPTTDKCTLSIPRLKHNTEIWSIATCTATGFSDRSFVGVTILHHGQTVVERQLGPHSGTMTSIAIAKLLVYKGQDDLEFDVDGADSLAYRATENGVTFAAYSSALP